MRLQDHTIAETKKAAIEVFRFAKAVPADKLHWKPLDTGRSVIDLARELGITPDWASDTLTLVSAPDWGPDALAKPSASVEQHHIAQRAEMESWKTVQECEAQCFKRLERFFEIVAALPDEQLTQAKWLPYEGGRDFTFAEMLDYPRWNFNYHLGQIAYIQILYGDKEMH